MKYLEPEHEVNDLNKYFVRQKKGRSKDEREIRQNNCGSTRTNRSKEENQSQLRNKEEFYA